MIHKNNFHMLPKVLNLSKFSISISKDIMSFDLDHMVHLSAFLSLSVDILGKEKRPDVKRDALWHISHDQLHII